LLLFARATSWLVIGFFVVLAALVLWWPLQALFVHIPLSYNEGWNAFHALRLRTGGQLYPPVSPAIFINYPPLSFYIVSALGGLIGDDIIAGRLIALAALLIAAFNAGLAARRLGAPFEIAIATAFAVLCFIGIYFTDYIGVDDPQWLAQAFQSCALVIVLGGRRDWRTILVAALLVVAGLFVKHNVLSLPIAITLWLLIEDRKALVRWLISTAAIGLAGLALCLIIYGTPFLSQLVGSRTTNFDVLILVGRHWGPQILPFLLAAAVGTWLWRKDSLGRFAGIYLGISLIVGVVLMTGAGVIYNTLFDLVIAMMLGCALLLRRLADAANTDSARASAITIALIILAARFIMISPSVQNGYADMRADLGQRDAWAATIERIRAEPKPVACETLALCYWAGRPSEIEFFNYGQKLLLDPGYAAGFISQLESRSIGLIQRDIAGGAKRLPPDLETIIAAHYRAVEEVPTELWTPLD
jgi:hypothetical protein